MKDTFSVVVLYDTVTFNEKILKLTRRANIIGYLMDSVVCNCNELPYPQVYCKDGHLDPDNSLLQSIIDEAITTIKKVSISKNPYIKNIVFINPNRPLGAKMWDRYPDGKGFVWIYKSLDDIGYFLIDINQDENTSFIVI